VSGSRDSTLTEPALDALNQEKRNNSQQYFNNLYQFYTNSNPFSRISTYLLFIWIEHKKGFRGRRQRGQIFADESPLRFVHQSFLPVNSCLPIKVGLIRTQTMSVGIFGMLSPFFISVSNEALVKTSPYKTKTATNT
jgi:hypothetical protein